jgi:ABC-type amino acid transport substrate-binding protein
MNETLAFVVKDYRRKIFSDMQTLQSHKGIRIGLFADTFKKEKIQRVLPHAEIVALKIDLEFFEGDLGKTVDGVLLTAERGSAWCLRYPDYAVALPRPSIMSVPLAYVVAHGNRDMLDFMNIWIDLKKKDKTIDRLYNYWILGQNAEKKQARWCVIRDVLHWIE